MRVKEVKTNAIIMVLTPEECSLLFNGNMSMLVRKSMPKKLTPPFKVYVYQKKHKGGKAIINEVLNSVYGGGKVIGEFVCDKVDCYPYGDMSFPIPAYDGDPTVCECGNGYYITCGELEKTCLEYKDLENYGKSKTLYGLHITAPKRYDKPKELHEFRAVCKKGKTKPNKDCRGCTYAFKGVANKEIICDRAIMRAPYTWVYVEEIKE